jgi:hypothetical protein
MPKTILDNRRGCSPRGQCEVVIRKISEAGSSPIDSSFETPAYRDMSLGPEELNCVESSKLAFAESL